MTFGHHLDIQQARVPRGGLDGVVQIQLFSRAGTRKFTEPAHRDFDIAGTQLNPIVEVLEVATIPYLHRAFVFAFTADANTFGVVAIVAKR